MSYRSVDEAFWTDPKVRALSSRDKMLFLYFITNPHASFSGVYYLPMPTVIFETAMDEKELRYGIHTLSVGYLVLHDEPNSMFWVVNMAKFQATSDKQQQGVRNHFKSLQKSPLLRMFAEKYPHIIDPAGYPTDTLSIGYPYPTDTQNLKGEQRETKYIPADLATAEDIFSHLTKLNPSQKRPNMAKWADSVRLLRERDGRTHGQILDLMAWVQSDSFWRTVILSPDKLREKWDALTIKKNAGKPSPEAAKSRADAEADELLEEGRRQMREGGTS